jgi:hypothetical protein
MGRAGLVIPVLMCGLLVSACSSQSPAAPKKISPAPVTTKTVRVGRFTQIFDTPLPADPAQASAVDGFRTGMILWDKSQENLMLVSPVTAYVTGSALRDLKASLVRTKADGVVPGGADRLFKTRVAMISGTGATITTCDDGSKFEEVDPRTGVPDPVYSAPATQQYLFETWQMIRLGGHWAISAVSPVTLPGSGAKPCQPLPALDRRPAIPRAPQERDTTGCYPDPGVLRCFDYGRRGGQMISRHMTSTARTRRFWTASRQAMPAATRLGEMFGVDQRGSLPLQAAARPAPELRLP